MLRIDEFETMSAEDAYDRYDWAPENEDTTVYRYGFARDGEDCEVFAAENLNGIWVSEVYQDGSVVGYGEGRNFAECVAYALVNVHGYADMKEEGNCEDAVNLCAYNAYFWFYGVDKVCDVSDIESLDALLGAARRFVRENIDTVDYEWREY